MTDDDDSLVLSDLISRVLDKGVVLSGDVVISVADIDLVKVELHVLLCAVETAAQRVAAAERRRVGE